MSRPLHSYNIGIVKFSFGWNTVSAVGEIPRDYYKHVLRLTIDRGPWHRTFLSLIHRSPRIVQNLARKIWPACFLPATVIVKKLKPGWEDDFEHEKEMYRRLKPLQGRLIPICYGEIRIEGARALVLSEVDGILGTEQTAPRLEPNEFRRRVETAYQELHTFGVTYEDARPRNVFLVDDKVVFIDLEGVWEPRDGDMDYAFETHVGEFMKHYNLYLMNCDLEWEWKR